MFLPFPTLALWSFCLTSYATARPASTFVSLFGPSPNALRDVPVGKTPISQGDMEEIARLAGIAAHAYCPPNHRSLLQPRTHRQNTHRGHFAPGSSIVASSTDRSKHQKQPDMNWFITHTPSTQTLTLAFSSLPSTDDLLEFLAADPPKPDDTSTSNTTSQRPHLVDLPSWLFPPSAFTSSHNDMTTEPSPLPQPKIHHSFLGPLETLGTDALLSLLQLLRAPPVPTRSNADVLRQFVTSLSHGRSHSHGAESRSGTSASSHTSLNLANPIRNVEIVGHGLGSAVGLLTALALDVELSTQDENGSRSDEYFFDPSDIAIRATLFGSPRVGDVAFARWVDQLQSPKGIQKQDKDKNEKPNLVIHRITSYADTITHLPARHLQLAHPTQGEIWIGADPRVAYACRPNPSYDELLESAECGGGFELPKTRVMDHSGPYAGVWVGPGHCGSRVMAEM